MPSVRRERRRSFFADTKETGIDFDTWIQPYSDPDDIDVRKADAMDARKKELIAKYKETRAVQEARERQQRIMAERTHKAVQQLAEEEQNQKINNLRAHLKPNTLANACTS